MLALRKVHMVPAAFFIEQAKNIQTQRIKILERIRGAKKVKTMKYLSDLSVAKQG